MGQRQRQKNIITSALVFCIRFYQKTLSLDHGPLKALAPFGFCRYYPSCSEYAIQSILKYGILTGGRRSLWRLFRCNPYSKGGIDY